MQAASAAVRPGLSIPRSMRAGRRAKVPASFEEALKQGWTVASENTAIALDGKSRRGKVILTKKGSASRLSVPYTATKTGFQFGVPRLVA